MKFSAQNLLLYAVTDRAWVGRQTLLEQIESALKGGVTLVQLREKSLPEEQLLQEAKEAAALCHRYGVPLIVNDWVEVALQSGADGVHVGIEDQPVEAIRRRAEAGWKYAGFIPKRQRAGGFIETIDLVFERQRSET